MSDPENPYDQRPFVARYARSRPRPPTDLFPLLTQMCGRKRPRLVVDLGCGTGLSTVPWSGIAGRVVGVESNPLMLRRAPRVPGVEYRRSPAQTTGLPTGSADIVTCSQSFHWMPRKETIREVARILRPGAVLAVYDYQLPPLIDPALDPVFADLLRWSGLPTERTDKATHVTNLTRSGRFRWVRPFCLHYSDTGNAARLLDLALSIAHVSARLDGDARSREPHWRRFSAAARRTLGQRRRRFWWTFDVVLAVK